MEFRVLGPLEAIRGARSLPLGGRKQRALLAMLLTRTELVHRSRASRKVTPEHSKIAR
jgi:DNA-binding SARP family transcriptional activator